MPKVSKNSDQYKSVFGNAKRDNQASGGGADWSTVDTGVLVKFIDAVTSRGGAVRLGYTRDGGAYAVGLYYGGESTSEYCRPSEDLDAFLNKWTDFYLNLPMTGGKSPDQRG